MRVGLTGGIAAGKSTIGGMFEKCGCHLIQSDRVAHELMMPGHTVYEEVVKHFGRSVLAGDGKIDRARLADAAFASQERIQELNAMVHPAVFREENGWMDEIERGHPGAIAMVEAALIIETGGEARFRKLVVVTCNAEQRVRRWALRRGIDEDRARADVARRMAAQLPDEVKVARADYVIDNSGSLAESEVQVHRVFAELKGEAIGLA